MTEAELLEYMIINAVGKGVEAALEKHLKPLKEELAKVKALNAKILKEQMILKEGYTLQEQSLRIPQIGRPTSVPAGPSKVLNEASRAQELNYLKSQAAGYVKEIKGDGHLPDIDIDPGLFLKKLG